MAERDAAIPIDRRTMTRPHRVLARMVIFLAIVMGLAVVLGQPLTSLPSAIADLVVSGTFVSLKRGKHLRGCCGGLQPQPVSLGSLLPDAVQRTAFEDPRFPPVSSTELAYLDVEVWLLFNPQRVAALGPDRAGAVVTGGKHGVVVRWAEQRGLLLPGVAAEHDWDATTFLDHVCLKAGLHPSRWREDDTHLMTFEGLACRAPLGREGQGSDWRFLSDEQVAAYTEFCRDNLAMLLAGRVAESASVVTVAANLDIDTWADARGARRLTGSLNPARQPPLPAAVLQRHYAGGRDEIVPPEITRRGLAPAAAPTIIPDYDHRCCWEEIWPAILADLAEDGL